MTPYATIGLMTVDAPPAAAATTHPLRFVQPVIAALASAGVVTLAVRELYGYPQILPETAMPVMSWLVPITAVLMLTLPAAIVAMRPGLGRLCGWPLVAAGVAATTLILPKAQVGFVGDVALSWTLAVVAGLALALSGVMVVAAQAGVGERVAIVAGVAFAFANQRFNLLRMVLEPYGDSVSRLLPFYIVIGLALAAALMALTQHVAHDVPQRGFAAFLPVLVVVAISSAVQLGHFVRRRIADEQTSQYSALALAVVAGAILLWLGYRRGRVALARWIALGFALGAPSLVIAFSFYYFGPAGHGPFIVSAMVATLAGVALALFADRFFPWDALGVVITATGIMLSSAPYIEGRPFSNVANVLITGGFGFAFAAGLTRAVRKLGAAGHGAGQVAMSLLLGLVALFVTADAISPAAWTLLSPNGFDGPTIGTPVIVLVAGSVLLLVLGFLRSAAGPVR